MALTFLGQPLRSALALRMAVVLVFVLALHACGLYEVAAGLSTLKPEDATQATLAVSLLAPPPPSAAAPAPTPPRPPRPRSPSAPSLPAPPAPPLAAPIEPPSPEPPPPEPVAALPGPDLVPAPQTSVPAEDPGMLAGLPAAATSGRIAYRTTYSRLRGITATTLVDWSVDQARGRYELWLRTIDPAGLLDLKSSGALRNFGIAPDRYVERVEIANRELRAEFDWAARVVAFTGRGAGQPAGFMEGTQDPLSLQFHVPLLAQAYPWRFAPGAEISFAIARRSVENYVFRVEGYEAVRIRDTDVQALKIDRKRGPQASRRVEIWMAPEYQWLPVRLRFTDANEEVWDSVLAVLPGAELPSEPIQQEPVKP